MRESDEQLSLSLTRKKVGIKLHSSLVSRVRNAGTKLDDERHERVKSSFEALVTRRRKKASDLKGNSFAGQIREADERALERLHPHHDGGQLFNYVSPNVLIVLQAVCLHA